MCSLVQHYHIKHGLHINRAGKGSLGHSIANVIGSSSVPWLNRDRIQEEESDTGTKTTPWLCESFIMVDETFGDSTEPYESPSQLRLNDLSEALF